MAPRSSCPPAFLWSLLLVLLPEARGDCDPPRRIPGSQQRQPSQVAYPVGTKLTYTCQPGYEPIPGARPSIECLGTSQWSRDPEFCQGKRCPVPDLENGRVVEDSDFRLGEEITFACDVGHRIVGQNGARCILRGNNVIWDREPPHCERIPCYPPPAIPDGRHDGQRNYVYGTAVTYRCNDPFSLIGNKTLVCLSDKDENGMWSSPAPRCEMVSCRAPTVANGIMVTSYVPSYKYQDQINFRCNEGYHLKGNRGVISCGANSTWEPHLPECILGAPPTGAPPDVGTVTSAGATVTPELPNDKPGGSGTPAGVIAGAVVGAMAVVAIIIALGYKFYTAQLKRKGKSNTTAAPTESYTPVPSNGLISLEEKTGKEIA